MNESYVTLQGWVGNDVDVRDVGDTQCASFRLGCTPMVNLFERLAEPVRLSQTKTEYRIVPDQHNQLGTEVYSVDRVT